MGIAATPYFINSLTLSRTVPLETDERHVLRTRQHHEGVYLDVARRGARQVEGESTRRDGRSEEKLQPHRPPCIGPVPPADRLGCGPSSGRLGGADESRRARSQEPDRQTEALERQEELPALRQTLLGPRAPVTSPANDTGLRLTGFPHAVKHLVNLGVIAP